MTETKLGASPTLKLRRTFQAPRERVYAAWTQPDLLKEWFGPPGYSVPQVEADVVVGGAYRITIRDSDGGESVVVGVFREVRAPEHLAYTWRWEQSSFEDPDRTTLVRIDFHDLGGETEVVLIHEGFAGQESVDAHGRGWGGALEKLAALLQ